MPVDSSGRPLRLQHVYASGNVAADMLANVSCGVPPERMLACQSESYKMERTDHWDGRNMLQLPRGPRHHATQNQWLAAWEEAGGPWDAPSHPGLLPQAKENQEMELLIPHVRDGGVHPRTPGSLE